MDIVDARVRHVAEQNAAVYPNDAGLIEELRTAVAFFQQLPPEFRFEFNNVLKPEKLGATPAEAFLNLLQNWHGWIGFFAYSIAYKVWQLVEDLASGLNSSRYLLVASSTRGIVEQVAVFNYYFTLVAQHLKEIQATDPNDNLPQYIGRIIDLIKLLNKYAQATRFNWKSFVAGDLDTFLSSWDQVDQSVKQTNILTMIDKLPQQERAARFYYEMLCDFVHPNVGSHSLVIDRVELIDENRTAYTLAHSATTEESLAAVLHIISIPLKMTLSLLRSELGSLLETLSKLEDWIKKCNEQR